MTVIHVRDVDAEVHAALVEAAAEAGMSLSEFLRRELAAIAARPAHQRALRRMAELPRPKRPTTPVTQVLDEVRQERVSQLVGGDG